MLLRFHRRFHQVARQQYGDDPMVGEARRPPRHLDRHHTARSRAAFRQRAGSNQFRDHKGADDDGQLPRCDLKGARKRGASARVDGRAEGNVEPAVQGTRDEIHSVFEAELFRVAARQSTKQCVPAQSDVLVEDVIFARTGRAAV